MKFIWFNGAVHPREEVRISPVDHGVVTGDGLFETLIAFNGKPFALTRHIARLTKSAQGMLMDTALIAQTDWATAIDNLLKANDLSDARVRITYTTGEADLGSDRGSAPPTIMIAAGSLPKFSQEGGKLSLVPFPRNERGALAGLKTISYGENVKALLLAKTNGANEALFLNLQGYVCEGTGTNVGWIKDGKYFTPSLATGCLAGITRALVLETAKKIGLETNEVEAPLATLLDADEVFLTSTLRHVQWVSSVDEKTWDKSGNVYAKKLCAAFLVAALENLDP